MATQNNKLLIQKYGPHEDPSDAIVAYSVVIKKNKCTIESAFVKVEICYS